MGTGGVAPAGERGHEGSVALADGAPVEGWVAAERSPQRADYQPGALRCDAAGRAEALLQHVERIRTQLPNDNNLRHAPDPSELK